MIQMQISPERIRAAVIVLVLVLFVTVCGFGFVAGRDLARADLVVGQAQGLAQGLAYFYADQDRFPSPQEFAEQASFGVYAQGVPVHTVSSKACPTVLGYESLTLRTFSITYCIPRSVNGLPQGVHEVTNRDVGI